MTALSILLKASVVLLAAAGITFVSRRWLSAATRHLIWTLAASAMLLLPALSVTLPQWTAVSLPSALAVPGVTPVDDRANRIDVVGDPVMATPSVAVQRPIASRPMAWSAVLGWTYGAGVLFLLFRMVGESLLLRRLASRATVEDRAEWLGLAQACSERLRLRRPVRLLWTNEETMPMAFGILQTAVVLPREADRWSPARREAVLLHELAHVARFDCLTQTLAMVACAVYWVHPGAWWMVRRLRIEREFACDDCVIASGIDARDYAGHLLEIAYAFARRRAPMVAVPMAGSGQLEGRMLALLDAARRRSGLVGRGRVMAAALALAALMPVAAATVSSVGRSSSPPIAAGAVPETEAPVEVSGSDVGTWEIRPVVGSAATMQVHLQMNESHSSHGHTVDVSALEGVSATQLAGTGPVSITIRRDAGTFRLDGVTRGGIAAGTYLFEPSEAFGDALVRRGMARPSPAQQRLLARQDIGLRFLDQLSAAGQPRPTLDDIIRAARHGVDSQYIDGLARAGYRNLSLEELINLRNHGVDPDYIQEMNQLGYRSLGLPQLLDLRNHGVDPDYVSGLAALGHRSLPLEQLLNLRNHGVDADYISGLSAHGYRSLGLLQLLDLRNHGVDPDYVSGLAALGYRSLTIDQLLTLRNHGVDPDYVSGLKELGYSSLSLDRLVELRTHGVDPDYIREMARAGYAKASLDTLIELRRQGVDGTSAGRRR
jgi:beta-lactamase regulating signal transducer with metallopeptidase domain